MSCLIEGSEKIPIVSEQLKTKVVCYGSGFQRDGHNPHQDLQDKSERLQDD